jgi:hypothetical protein
MSSGKPLNVAGCWRRTTRIETGLFSMRLAPRATKTARPIPAAIIAQEESLNRIGTEIAAMSAAIWRMSAASLLSAIDLCHPSHGGMLL